MTTFTGTDGADLIDQSDLDGGVDRIEGRGGDDTLIARTDDTTLVGGAGDDVFVFAGAPGSARSFVAEDFLGGDAFFLDALGDYRLREGLLNDDGDAQLSFAVGGGGTLALTLSGGQDIFVRTDARVDGVAGDLFEGIDGARPPAGADALVLDAFAYDGGDGADTVFGSAGADDLSGAGGADLLFGLDGNDLLTGGAGNDVLYGDGA